MDFIKDYFHRTFQNTQQMFSLFGSTYMRKKLFEHEPKLRPKLTDEHLQAMLRIHSTDSELKLNDIIKITIAQVTHFRLINLLF